MWVWFGMYVTQDFHWVLDSDLPRDSVHSLSARLCKTAAVESVGMLPLPGYTLPQQQEVTLTEK
jgi:hypothetical protein